MIIRFHVHYVAYFDDSKLMKAKSIAYAYDAHVDQILQPMFSTCILNVLMCIYG